MASIVSPNIDYEEKKISEMTDIKFDDITKIIFYDGRGGLNKALLVEDKGKIKEFMGYLDSFVIKKSRNPELPSGWSHAAEFYINEKKVMKITFMNPMTVNNKDVYDIMKADLYINQIDKFLKSIDPSHKDFD